MAPVNADPEPLIRRRAFPSWSISIPASFEEAFDVEGGYWHAFGHDRSVSLTSMILTESDGSYPSAQAIAAQMSLIDGAPVTEIPGGVLGWAVKTDAVSPARASRLLQGMLATDGHALIVTITSDDGEWARRTWLSIRRHG